MMNSPNPRTRARISPILTKSTRHRPRADAWSSYHPTFSAPNRPLTPSPTFSDLTYPRLRERSFGEWEGMTREEILEQYADDYHSWRAHTGGETKHGVESRRHTGQRGSQAIRSIIAEHADDPTATTLLAVGHGSWIVATVAVLLDMDPDDLNNLGAMRNAFWTSMSVNTGGSNGPADPDTWQWKLDAFNQGPAIAALTDWENGPKELRGPNMPLWKPIVQ